MDIVINGDFGQGIRTAVATGSGIDTSTRDGQETLNSTMLGVELAAAHAVFKGGIDPQVPAQTSTIAASYWRFNCSKFKYRLTFFGKGLTTYNDGNNALDNVIEVDGSLILLIMLR